MSGNCLIWLSLEWGEGLSIWDIKISGIYNSKLVKNFLIKCVRELFDLVEFGLGLGFENLINKKVVKSIFILFLLLSTIMFYFSRKIFEKKRSKNRNFEKGFFRSKLGKIDTMKGLRELYYDVKSTGLWRIEYLRYQYHG